MDLFIENNFFCSNQRKLLAEIYRDVDTLLNNLSLVDCFFIKQLKFTINILMNKMN